MKYSLISLSLMMLTACDPVTFSGNSHAVADFNLTNTKGDIHSFQSEKPESIWGIFEPGKKTVTLSIGNESFLFKGAKALNDNEVVVSAKKSGQNVGLSLKREVICNPECETVWEEVYKNQPCQIVAHEMRNTASYPIFYGFWDVKVTSTQRSYKVTGSLYTVSGVQLTALEGTSTIKIEKHKAITYCH